MLSASPQHSPLVQAAIDFRERLTRVKRDAGAEFDWYPYDSLTNVETLDRLLGGNLDVAGRDVLDVGCGDGDLSFFLESLGARVYAVDHAQTNHNGMRGVRTLKAALGSNVQIIETDLDVGFTLPDVDFSLVFALGLLYHLKNPFYFLEKLARTCRSCIMSTRIARCLPDRKTDISAVPVAYLVGARELNEDDSNYWILSETCLRQLFRRTNWRLCEFIRTGDTESPDPIAPDHDGRIYCRLESCSGLKNVELRSGWHKPEGEGWRWTERRFSAVLPRDRERKALLQMHLYVHPAVVGAAGPLTLSCTVDGVPLAPETYGAAGNYVYARELGGRQSSIEAVFELSGALPPEESDPRERGLIVAWLSAED